jgi:SAM-dependent methyltransferase
VKLNLGCGEHRNAGWVGVDRVPSPATQVVCDLGAPLPFLDGSVEEVMLDNVVEHITDLVGLMREVARIGRTGARVVVRTPHFSALASWRDPTHVHHLSYFSLDHVSKVDGRRYASADLTIERRKLSFGGGPFGLLGRLFFALSPEFYEKHLCFVLRASTLTFELRVAR